ncbi:MAG: LamG domain-containing protein [bacterium]|nr:LamG domain-containing protein [bacterium]
MIRRSLLALVLALPATSQNLVVHYRLDETSGTGVSDSSGNGLDAQLFASPQMWVPGQIGGGLALNGFGHHARAASDPLHDVAQLSITAWVNVNVLGDWDGVLTKGINTSPYALQLGFPIGKFKFTANWGNPVGGVGGGTWTSSADLLPATWHHLGVTFDGNEVRLYLDGGLDSVHAAAGVILGTAAESLTLGADFPGGDEFFDGILDDVRLYDGPLSASDIASLAQIGGPVGTIYCSPALPNSTGLPATIAATGSASATLNELTLTIDQVPPNQFGYFLTSRTQGLLSPPGSSGLLCLSNDIGRYNAIADIFQGPTASLIVDLTAIPVNPPVAVVPGDTFNFQAWYRDNNPMLTSNFSDGVEVVFQ